MTSEKSIAIIGAGMAGISCAQALRAAGRTVSVFEAQQQPGGRMSSLDSPFGSFDLGAQYFTVRNQGFSDALRDSPELCRPWSANAVRTLDEHGAVVSSAAPDTDTGWVASNGNEKPAWTLPMTLNSGMHWVGVPRMGSLLDGWSAPLLQDGSLHCQIRITSLERNDAGPWRLHGVNAQGDAQVWDGFDAVLLALPAPQALPLLKVGNGLETLAQPLGAVRMAPSWALSLAYAQAVQPGLTTLGPQWNAARSTHHRVSWLARESSKPQRGQVERWTVQASAAWSQEHLKDSAERVSAKLQKAFSEITGIVAEPHFIHAHRWAHAKTLTPLRQSHLWSAALGVGLCGDWCLGYRVEDAFISGRELARATLAA